MFGGVPNELDGDICTVEELPMNRSKVVIRFEGYNKPFTVHSNALVGIAAPTPPQE
jgi:hypothetical protein